MTDAPDITNRTFTIPTNMHRIEDAEQRVARGVVIANAARPLNDVDVLEYSLETGEVDLDLLRSGRAPLLESHYRTLENLLGRVEEVWVNGGGLDCLVRFCRGGQADRIWQLLQEDFPLSLSVGARILHATPIGKTAKGGAHYRVDRWRLDEISVVLYGQDQDAWIRPLRCNVPGEAQLPLKDDDVAGRPKMAAAQMTAATAEVRRRLSFDDWQSWGMLTGIRLAERFGLDRDDFCDAFDEEMRNCFTSLETRYALPVVDAPAEEREAA